MQPQPATTKAGAGQKGGDDVGTGVAGHRPPRTPAVLAESINFESAANNLISKVVAYYSLGRVTRGCVRVQACPGHAPSIPSSFNAFVYKAYTLHDALAYYVAVSLAVAQLWLFTPRGN